MRIQNLSECNIRHHVRADWCCSVDTPTCKSIKKSMHICSTSCCFVSIPWVRDSGRVWLEQFISDPFASCLVPVRLCTNLAAVSWGSWAGKLIVWDLHQISVPIKTGFGYIHALLSKLKLLISCIFNCSPFWQSLSGFSLWNRPRISTLEADCASDRGVLRPQSFLSELVTPKSIWSSVSLGNTSRNGCC